MSTTAAASYKYIFLSSLVSQNRKICRVFGNGNMNDENMKYEFVTIRVWVYCAVSTAYGWYLVRSIKIGGDWWSQFATGGG